MNTVPASVVSDRRNVGAALGRLLVFLSSFIPTAAARFFSLRRRLPAPAIDSISTNLRSAVGAALTRELFHFSLPTPRSAHLRIGVSLSSFNLSWSPN